MVTMAVGSGEALLADWQTSTFRHAAHLVSAYIGGETVPTLRASVRSESHREDG
ncbi:hypothetical protein [Cryobacterium serini]|uniref:hypothetical protein n=1 Tax=Cryobacterium serini TaxID=1259201 RepID=UPI00141B946C|nr:hypothetical protein [Cryobacterium serini]